MDSVNMYFNNIGIYFFKSLALSITVGAPYIATVVYIIDMYILTITSLNSSIWSAASSIRALCSLTNESQYCLIPRLPPASNCSKVFSKTP